MSELSGFWINHQYQEILLRTRSPKAAFDAGLRIPFFELNGQGIQWGIHDGNGFGVSSLMVTSTPNKFRLVDTDNQPMPHFFITGPADSLRRIRWIGTFWRFEQVDTELTQDFVRLQDSIAHYCNQVVIAGSYRDQHELKYVFTAQGVAKWPDKTFQYEVGLDYAFEGPDYIINWSEFDSTKNGWVAYGFRWNEGQLLLFQEKPWDPEQGEEMIVRDTPFVILKPE